MGEMKTIHLLLFGRFLAQLIMIHAKVSSIIVFGDSTVDAGNNNQVATVLRSNFQPYGRDFYGSRPTGRFCNGRIATDFISEAFGIRSIVPAYLDPMYNMVDFVKGVSFASAGTGYDNLTAAILSVIPLWKELEYFKEYQTKLKVHLGGANASKVLSEALYLISIGTNDFLENYFALPVRSRVYTIEEYEKFLINIAKKFTIDLYNLGARKISLNGLPPMGCLPLERTESYFGRTKCVQIYNRVAKEFNVKLKHLVKKLNKELGGIQLVYSDVYNILSDIIRNPRSFDGCIQLVYSDIYNILSDLIKDPPSFGFDNGERACCATGRFEMSYLCNRFNPFTCKFANKYVFWDSFHPSEKTNLIVAQHAIKTSLVAFL